MHTFSTITWIIILLCVSCLGASSSCVNQCYCEPMALSNCCASLQDNHLIVGKTTFVPRSQDTNAPRDIMLAREKFSLTKEEDFHLLLDIALEYQQMMQRSVRSVGAWFSIHDGPMTYGLDNATPGTEKFDINGLNFGLTSSGSFQFCPKKSDFIIDFTFLLENLFCNAWLRIDIPVTHTQTQLRVIEQVTGKPSEFYPLNSVGSDTIEVVFTTMKAALSTEKGFGDAPTLERGKVEGCLSATKIAGLRIDIGYDWIKNDQTLFATSFDAIAPTGTRVFAFALFEPEIGESKQWQLGGHIEAAQKIWHNADDTKSLAFLFDGTFDCLLKSKQNRLFGLFIDSKQSPWSQYLLLKQFNNASQAIALERAANILGAGDVIMGSSFLVDMAFLLQYKHEHFVAGIGYDFWTRTQEHISARCFSIPEKTYGIKGGTQWNSNVDDPNNNQTASKSTIGKNAEPDQKPVFISNDDIDYCVALQPLSLSNSLFGYIGYYGKEQEWEPYIVLGSQLEFGHLAALSQWAIMIKGGYNI